LPEGGRGVFVRMRIKAFIGTRRSLWKIITGASIILTTIVAALQINEKMNLSELVIVPLFSFTMKVPIFLIVLLIAPLLTYLVLFRIPFLHTLLRLKSSILDLEEARMIAVLCTTPRSTNYLRRKYDIKMSQSSDVAESGCNFDSYMKRLEKQGYLLFDKVDGKWVATQKAVRYIEKYHGDVYTKE